MVAFLCVYNCEWFVFVVVVRWLKKEDDTPSWDIHGTLQEAVYSGAQDWFAHINESSKESQQTDEDKLLQIIKITQLVRADLKRGMEYYDKLFQQLVKLNNTQLN